jgi:hypothetical protein
MVLRGATGRRAPRGRLRRPARSAAFIAALLALFGPAAAAEASGPPTIEEAWVSAVFTSTARLNAQINPNGLSTTYHLDYLPEALYDANAAEAKDPFAGALRSPPSSDAGVGAGTAAVKVGLQLSSLSADTRYRYRFVAKNSSAPTGVTSGALVFATPATPGGAFLPDNRGWEMVSPVDKNGGEVASPGALAAGGVLQAGGAGGAVTYASSASFGAGAQGAASASQYIGVRTNAGWTTQNITTPLYSGSYGTADEGVPYQLFSGDLAKALLLNGRHCRGEGTDCAVPNPPLPGTDAPAGYQNYYLREGAGYTALLGAANAGFLALEPADFELRLAGAAPDLRHAVLSTCAALTAGAVEVPPVGGCDPNEANLYEYSPGGGLTLINLLPAQTSSTPGAELAAQSGGISADGSRVYFDQGGSLYLREGSTTKLVDAGVVFQTASADGSVAYFTKGGDLHRFLATGAGSATPLTSSHDVQGVLGTSENGASVYYLTATGLFVWKSGTTSKVADGADASNYPPQTGTSRVSADGTRLLFVSTAPLTGYDNTDEVTKTPYSQVYLYDATGAGSLTCVSCNPTFARPVGPSSIPGATANGSVAGSIHAYKPRVLSADGRRVFFDSDDAIGLTDTNKAPDVYQWEAQGTGSCIRARGCVALISSGRSSEGALFLDASADGSDAFFLTDESLISSDPGAGDLYDARVGGGFPVSSPPPRCIGDACQPLPSEPVDPTLTTLLSGPGNPAVRYPAGPRRCKKSYVKRRGKCVRQKRKARGRKRAQRRHRGNAK